MPPVPKAAIVPLAATLATTIWRSDAFVPPGVSPAARTEPSASVLSACKLVPPIRMRAPSTAPCPVAL